MVYQGNIGFLHQRLYYAGIKFDMEKKDAENKSKFKERNDELFNCGLTYNSTVLAAANKNFNLTTTYPGLLAGSGQIHETGMEGELKLGFSFDHTCGLPVIPGSSIKGVLREVLVDNKALLDALLSSLPEELAKKVNDAKREQIFEGKGVSSYKQDIFFDAMPNSITQNNLSNTKVLLGMDNLCPHPDPLKDPIPIAFLKVMPAVSFLFQFRLTDSCGLTADEKEQIFKQALLLHGVGAKTNVGYGQLQDQTPELRPQSVGITRPISTDKPKSVVNTLDIVGDEPQNYQGKIKVGEQLQAKFLGDKKALIIVKGDRAEVRLDSCPSTLSVADIIIVKINTEKNKQTIMSVGYMKRFI